MHVTTARVRYFDTDKAGVAYHGNYLRWFEIGRSEMLRDLGESYHRFEQERHLLLTVVEVVIQYHQPARYDEVLVIQSEVTDVKKVRLRIQTRILRQDGGDLLCTGHLWLACVAQDGRPTALPEDFRARLQVPAPAAERKILTPGAVQGGAFHQPQ